MTGNKNNKIGSTPKKRLPMPAMCMQASEPSTSTSRHNMFQVKGKQLQLLLTDMNSVASVRGAREAAASAPLLESLVS